MDSRVKLYIDRAENEFRLAKAVFNLSENEKVKIELEANPNDTFYSAVISHSYYSIFYSAKAILLSKGIKTEVPDEHRKTFFAFKENFVDSGLLDKELLIIYDDIIVKADELLSLFAHEKWKRGHFTYKTISQANVEPAQESIDNTIKFLANIKAVIEKQDAEEKIGDIQKVYKVEDVKSNSMLPGDSQGSPDESLILNKTLIFIDETFLEKLSKYFGRGKYIKFNKVLFAKNLAKKQKLHCKNIFYYTAPPFQSDNPTKEEEKRKYGYDRFVNKLREKGVVVREGRCQKLKVDGEFIFKQKAVDILLAMDLMSVPLKYPEIKRIILISSDSDFVSVIENLRANGVKTILDTYYEKIRDTPFSRSNHLVKSVYKYVLLTEEDFLNAPLERSKNEMGEDEKIRENKDE